jgi:class 3 adenylate cyclase
MAMQCATCGHVNATGQKFCGECGTRLNFSNEVASGPSLRAYTPPHLVQKILTTRSALEGERKPVTVLFCDIADSTNLAERLGPERMHAVLSAFFETALAEVHRFDDTGQSVLG